MKKTLILVFILAFNLSFAQTGNKQSCKVEFYLLKKVVPYSGRTPGKFDVSLTDLQDTAFIKDFEIVSCFVHHDTIRINSDKTKARYGYLFETSKSVVQRIENLNIPLCCGRQFAVVANGQICYTGYFWNFISSFGCDWITAFAHGTSIDILRKLPDYDYKVGDDDARKSKLLFDCLSATNRLSEK